MVDKLTNIIIPKYKLKYKIQRNKNIIQASLDKNIKLPFSCRSGICGTCKAKIINGEVSINNKINHVLSEVEKKNNIILACQAEAKSDNLELEILSPMKEQTNTNMPKEIISEILSVKLISSKVKEVSISVSKRFIINLRMLQYIEIIIPGIDISEKYYINTRTEFTNSHSGLIKIFLTESSNKIINDYLLKYIKIGEIITVKGPYLENNIAKTSILPLLFLVQDLHIIKAISMINNILSEKFDKPIMLLCLYNNKDSIYFMEKLHELQYVNNNFAYKIFISKLNQTTTNRFLSGDISKNLNKIFPDLSNHFIWIGGEKTFIKNTKIKVIQLNGKEKNICINY